MNGDDLIYLFTGITWFAGILTGLIALIAMLRRAPRSRFRGEVSVLCLVISFLSILAKERRPPPMSFLFLFFLLATPGTLAIIFVRPPRHLPGQCMTCGYNMTGNTTGVCSECGTAVRCKTCGYDLRGNVSGKCSECGEPVVTP